MKMTDRFLALAKAATLAAISVFLPAGCGDDAQAPGDIVDSGGSAGTGTGQEVVVEEFQRTVFSSGGDVDTRSSLDAFRHFYWEPGDKILVDINGTYTLNDSSTITGRVRQADFYFDSVTLNAPSYNVLYTGTGASPSATHVAIAQTQTQQDWDDATHLGTSGDCGTARARLRGGVYEFTLEHQAAYLILQPYKPDAITDGWKLTAIDIIDAEGKTLCGTYPFGMSGLDTAKATQRSNSVRLTCSGGFALPDSTAWVQDKGSCFAVIQPGRRNLRIRYHIRPTGSANGTAGATFSVLKEIDGRDYTVNGVTTISHELRVGSYSPMLYYMWDAVNPYWHGVPYANIPKIYGGSAGGYPTSASDANNRWFNATVSAPTPASRSCKDMPNANALSWYAMGGDPRWETDYPWIFEGNNGSDVYSTGVWILKKEHISGFSSDVSDDGVTNLISTAKDYVNDSDSYKRGGRPSAELGKYFFLPALSRFSYGALGSASYPLGCYWSSSPRPGGGTLNSYYIDFDRNSINTANNYPQRNIGRVVAPEWFQ